MQSIADIIMNYLLLQWVSIFGIIVAIAIFRKVFVYD